MKYDKINITLVRVALGSDLLSKISDSSVVDKKNMIKKRDSTKNN